MTRASQQSESGRVLPAGRIASDPPYWTCECGAVLDEDMLTREVHGLWHLIAPARTPSATTANSEAQQ